MTQRMAPLTLTQKAAQRVQHLLAQAPQPAIGIRVGVTSKGCSGLSYSVEYAQEKAPLDEVVEAFGVQVLIDPKAMMFILGSEMDYVEDKLSSGFVFTNPNEKGRCGCGESFTV